MKKIIFCALALSYCVTTLSTLKANGPTLDEVLSFGIGCTGGLVPVLGHGAIIRALLDFRRTPDLFNKRVKPASFGLATGAAAWFMVKDFLKTKFDVSSWQPYIWPSVPSVLVAIMLVLVENKGELDKLKLRLKKAH